VASTLVAALNTVLRSHRNYVRQILTMPAHKEVSQSVDAPHGKASSVSTETKQQRLKKAISEFARRLLLDIRCGADTVMSVPDAATLVAAADEASRLATFCSEARQNSSLTSTICFDVLLAFSVAFEREAMQLCKLIVEAHFATTHRLF